MSKARRDANTQAAWGALWTCPDCGGQRKGFHWQGPTPEWECACGWSRITRHEWDIYFAFLYSIGFDHIDPIWLAKWNELPEARDAPITTTIPKTVLWVEVERKP